MPDGFFDIDRRTELWCNLPNTALARHAWSLSRSGAEIRQQRKVYTQFFGGLFNAGHVLFTGDAWIITPYGHDPAELLTTEGDFSVKLADVNLAPHHRVYETYRRTTTPGAGQSGDLLTIPGGPAFQRRRAAGVPLDTGNLDADEAAQPSPIPPTAPLIPNDRILSGVVTYPANQPFWLSFQTVTGAAEDVATFHFGGPAEVFPASQSGGQFCVQLKASGRALLFEWDAEVTEGDPWKPVWEFTWKHRHDSGDFNGLIENNNLFIVPYGRNEIAFYNLGAGYAGSADRSNGITSLLVTLAIANVSAIEARQGVPIRLFAHRAAQSDHLHLSHCTGPGTIRMNRPRTDRLPFRITAPHYRESAFLVDAPFFIDTNTLPLATHMALIIDGYAPPGTTIVGTIYDADTGVALLRTGSLWLTNDNQRRYFVGFTLNSPGDPDATPPVAAGEQTPVLRGYTVNIGPAFAEVAAEPLKTARLKGLSITGSGLSPQEENASVQVVDEIDELAILRVRDQMRTKLVLVRRDNGVPLSVLFEGQTASPEATLRGVQDGSAYPSPDWHNTDGRLTGMWPRLFRQFHRGMPMSFVSSESSAHPAPGLDGGWLPWLFTDSLRFCFNNAGVPDTQLDVPASPLRFPASASLGPGDYNILPGSPYGKFIEELPRDYLGQLLIRDPNTGAIDSTGLPTGMWRLLVNPSTTSGNYLAVLDLDAAPYSVDPYFVMAEGARGAGVWPIIRDTWKPKPKAAEGNMVTVYGVSAAGGSDDGGKLLTSYPLVNAASFDPASPHWLEGETVPIIRAPDPFLTTQEIVDWVARVIYRRSCFAEKWWTCTIPLALVVDPLDPLQVLPRPLRINDLVQVRRNGTLYPAIIRSCNPAYESDFYQMCTIEGKFLDASTVI
jgi:hypothetical protein